MRAGITGRVLYRGCNESEIIIGTIPKELNPFVTKLSSGYSYKEILYYFDDRYLFIDIDGNILKIDCLRDDLHIFNEVNYLFKQLKVLGKYVDEYEVHLKNSLIECLEEYVGVFGLSDVKLVVASDDRILIKLKSPLCEIYENTNKQSGFTGLIILHRLTCDNLEEDLKSINIDSRRYVCNENRVKNHLMFRRRVANCLLKQQ